LLLECGGRVPIAVTTLIKMLVVIEKPWCSVAVEQCLVRQVDSAWRRLMFIAMRKIEPERQAGVELRL
jgi:hypothetical protein